MQQNLKCQGKRTESIKKHIREKDTKVKLQHNWKTKDQRNQEASSVEETTFIVLSLLFLF